MSNNEYSFKDDLITLSNRTGLSQKAISEKLGVPLRTYEDWRAGRRIPTNFVQNTVKIGIKGIIEENYSDEDIQRAVIEEAKKYDDNQYELFEAEYGWHDWMNRYTSAEDGAECSAEEINEINHILQKYFYMAHQI